MLCSVTRRSLRVNRFSHRLGFRTLGGSDDQATYPGYETNDPAPFSNTEPLSSRFLDAMAHETEGHPVIPGAAPLSARLRKSPFFEKTLTAGVKEFTVYNRMLMPLLFNEGADVEYKALTEDVAIWDVAAERQVQLKGPDAHKLAQLITCRDISNLKVGKGVYAIMTDQDGIVLNDPVLLKVDDETYWFSIADSDVLLWAKGVSVSQGFDVKVTEPDVAPLALQGPKSADLVKELYGDDDLIDSLGHFDFARDPVRTSIVSPTRPDLPPIPTLLARSGWSPELGYEIYLEDGARGGELWDICIAAGEKYNIKPGAPNQQRRLEAGMLSFGGDTLEDTNALELGLPKRFVNPFMEPEFIGKEALQKIVNEGGPKRVFCGFWFLNSALQQGDYMRGKHLRIFGTVDGDEDAMSEYTDGHELPHIGVVTALGYSSKFGKHIGLGYIDKRLEKKNAVVGVETSSGHMLAAKVSTLPFKVNGKPGGRMTSRAE